MGYSKQEIEVALAQTVLDCIREGGFSIEMLTSAVDLADKVVVEADESGESIEDVLGITIAILEEAVEAE